MNKIRTDASVISESMSDRSTNRIQLNATLITFTGIIKLAELLNHEIYVLHSLKRGKWWNNSYLILGGWELNRKQCRLFGNLNQFFVHKIQTVQQSKINECVNYPHCIISVGNFLLWPFGGHRFRRSWSRNPVCDDNYDILFVCWVPTHLKDYTEVLN